MEEELSAAIPCSSIGVESVLRVGTAGAIWGFCSAPYDARKNGLVAGIFSITRCGLQRYRKQNDQINTLIAGAVAGAAIAAKTRSWTNMIGMACVVSAFSAAADFSRTN
ncbi:hypothetical protein PTKIN_Ptkin12aG0136000 [Pterospermum kingtungense]